MNRVSELRDLSDDHHTALVLARACKRAGGIESEDAIASLWQHALATFAAHLEPHFEIEDRHLLPALEEIGEAGLAARIRADHAALRAFQGLPPGRRALANFGRLLERHVRFEEREVFEKVQHRLPARRLADIAAACRRRPRACPTALSA